MERELRLRDERLVAGQRVKRVDSDGGSITN